MLYVFEGINGVGKTHQINLFTKNLSYLNIPVEVFKVSNIFPNETLHLLTNPNVTSAQRVRSFIQLQTKLVNNYIKPALNSDSIVCCDRLWLSTLAYDKQTILETPSLEQELYNAIIDAGVPFTLAYLEPNINLILKRLKQPRALEINQAYATYKDKLSTQASYQSLTDLASSYNFFLDKLQKHDIINKLITFTRV